MSSSAKTEAPKQHNKKRQRRIAMLSLSAVFLVLALIYTIYWFAVLRHHQETEDAYVAGNQVQIMAQVAGSVLKVNVDNTDFVKQGDVLVELDSTDIEQALGRSKTALANAVRQTHQMIISSKQLEANISLRETELSKAKNDLSRREVLAKSHAIGKEELQHARDAYRGAESALEIAKQQYNANQAMILDTELAKQPMVEQAASQVRQAWMSLQRTKIISPITGYVSRRSVQVGAQVGAGMPMMAVVPADHLWVDANFKETQLANMRIGQKATVVSDFYGDKVEFDGKVVGIDMGTGSAFSLLPAQNATGNWIKVVQRLPVRIELDKDQIAKNPLRIGLSMHVNVDTADQSGVVLATSAPLEPRYQSDALKLDLESADVLIADIIAENAG